MKPRAFVRLSLCFSIGMAALMWWIVVFRIDDAKPETVALITFWLVSCIAGLAAEGIRFVKGLE